MGIDKMFGNREDFETELEAGGLAYGGDHNEIERCGAAACQK